MVLPFLACAPFEAAADDRAAAAAAAAARDDVRRVPPTTPAPAASAATPLAEEDDAVAAADGAFLERRDLIAPVSWYTKNCHLHLLSQGKSAPSLHLPPFPVQICPGFFFT